MATYDHATFDRKWQQYWEREHTFATPTDRTRPKYYVLDMFPYASGDGLHVGHPRGYTATDVIARAKRMMGFNVLRVMGWDSFGLPAERRAERDGIHPSVITARNIAIFKGQLEKLGLSYDWARELATSDPRYYKWTQWIFELLFERGLAYRAEVPVNFCPALGTVLANEEVHDGKYIETGDPVEKRLMTQWMLRITAYADRLVEELDGLDWPAGTAQMARGWIGKAGVATGAYAINPVNGAHIPIWVADYVLASYGTGAVFACPAHDERDWAFAKKFGLPIVEVVTGGDVERDAYLGDGAHVNSAFLDGLDVAHAKQKVIAWLEERGLGERAIRYRLRDWLFSRQRYWGEPFPTIELGDGTVKLWPKNQLPVVLPEIDEDRPTRDGQPPLARAREWLQTQDPQTGQSARRETNTMPQWAGSCWYYLRFLSPTRDDVGWDPAEEKYWMPIDLYVGGSEHATLHLLYARFWHKVLYDAGHVSTKEPFQRLVHQGMIHKRSFRDARGKYHYEDEDEERGGAWVLKGTDERVDASLEKMSKSKYNVVNPDDMCAQHAADAMRLYELFMGPIEDGTEWDTAGVAGTRRFLDRAWRLLIDPETDTLSTKITTNGTSENRELERALHAAIKKVTQSITDLRFNTAIAEMMIFVNEATKAPAIPRDWLETFVKILSPFAPHLAEEMWQRLGHTQTIAYAPWPAYDEAKLARDTRVLVVQVNGKVRGQIEVAPDASDATILTAARVDRNVQSFLGGKQIKREIYVKGRLVNLVA